MKAYDKLYIDGAWVAPSGTDTLDVINSTTEEVMAHDPGRRRGRRRSRRRPPPRPPSRRGRDIRAGRGRKYLTRINEGLSARIDEIAETIVAKKSACRRCCRQLIQVGLPQGNFAVQRAARRGLPVRGAGRQLARRSRAGRRRRLHHAVELPAAPDRGQGRAGAGRRLHGRAEAERGRAAQRVHARRDHRRGRPARRRVQPRDRRRPGGRRGDRRAPRRRHGVVHRLDPRRQARQRARRADGQAGARSSSAASRPTSSSTTPTSTKAVADGVGKCYLNSGQTCSALTRMLVPREQARRGRGHRGQGRRRDVHARRPVRRPRRASARSSRRRSATACAATSRRASTRAPRSSPAAPTRPKGSTRATSCSRRCSPTSRRDMTIAQEEIFGPVLSIIPYDDEDDAVAHRQRHRLRPRRRRVVRRRRAGEAGRPSQLRTGQVEVNGGGFNLMAPFGGYKQSGHGRELGKYGLEEFLEVKSLQL